MRATDRDTLVREYQDLDRALIAAATGTIIRAANARRPRSDIGESAIIHREAEKKKKHMPVRTLIERSRHVTQAIKPCFMMSPLAVSQYLPADMHFDVVIFDEASQVSPGDAINCIYRGSALILAGDQKQLPPSNFFAASTADDGDEWSEDSDDTAEFESILDLAKASGAYRSLTLRWHYRSLHEALIAFSNATFYRGQLVTFPSRHSDGPDVGVELFRVHGTYRRGTSRDNPEEAAKVAERVIHHYDTRPALSLGVVTFSEAQAEAIETAVSQARQDRPDLDRFFAKRPAARILRQEPGIRSGRRTGRADLLHRLRAGREPEDHHELRPAQQARRLAAAQRRHHPRPLPQRNRQQHPGRRHPRIRDHRGRPAPAPLPRLRRTRHARPRPRHHRRRRRRVPVRGICHQRHPVLGI